ncbi:hypothetical protein [Marinicella sp. W31]|uniref:hypothetical protein n=1 Tax=Marinicella sp. W31 TaxID=3023713 RepID=UPI003757FEBB
MSRESYSRTITVKNNVKAAYAALTIGFANWWTKPDVPLLKQGDQAKFTFLPGKSYWKFEAIELIPDEKVVMKCVEALHLHEGYSDEIKQEWLNTTVVFKINKRDEGTEISIEHIGLLPTLYCYKICEAGWDFFFTESLKLYLETGIGKPHQL